MVLVCALAGLIGLERLIELVVLRIGSRPIGLLWAWVSGKLGGLPQAELWAVLVAIFGWLGLRSLGFRVVRASTNRRTRSPSQGTLQSWLELLDNRSRGEYFRWRLARRVASLSDDLGLHAPANDPMIEAFLQTGRQLRTIHPQAARAELKLEPAILVEYLEGNQETRGDG
ncbi:MAG: hypothetical protein ACRDHG_15640 [Anaerolineales bacterium]